MFPTTADYPAQRTDHELLAAHLAGDPHAFAELFRRHHGQLIRLAWSRSRSAEDAADAVQEAMLAVHRGAATFRQHASVRTWLHRIVVNKCLDQIRRNRFLVRCDSHLRPVGHGVDGDVLTTVTVRSALATLSADQRAAVEAVDMDGYSVAEAARLLGIAEGTVKSRRARGRARLASVLDIEVLDTD